MRSIRSALIHDSVFFGMESSGDIFYTVYDMVGNQFDRSLFIIAVQHLDESPVFINIPVIKDKCVL